jgi:type IV secretion system protein VirB6
MDGLINFVFYRQILDFLNDELAEFQQRLVGDTMEFLGMVALVLLTIWIFWQGYRIVSGRSRDSMMGLVVDSLRATLIIAAATGFAAANSDIYDRVTNGLGNVIIGVVTGEDMDVNDLYGSMDQALASMELALAAVQSVQIKETTTGDATDAAAEKKRSMYFAGIGTMGPAITAGIMITLNKIALALFVGLGPIFIMCLLFDQTKSLFQRWLLYGIGTLFSLAVLYVMVYLAMDLTLAVAGALFAGQFLTLAGGQGISNMSMQLGSLGIILTMLLISAPPMAAAFFQGTLGQFMHYSVFGGMDRDGFRNSPGARGPAGEPYGAMGRNDARNPGGNTGAYNPGSSYASNTPTYSHRNLTPSSGPANV